MIRKIELLSPAKDKICGMEAILHGADAVYIGAPHHGARSAAGNSIDDIKELVDFAHVYNARIYVTVNTIIYDNEVDDIRRMICELYNIGVDALIVQDMGILEMDIPPIALHASTQMDNRTVEKFKFLEESGFSQAVLARELSLDEIRKIHENTNIQLEAFVHGALCVSYSGQCYVSQACFSRSANRGECAQFCRLPLTLKDANGVVIAKDKHLLSLKDMNRSEYLEQLLDAGVSSLKIEGRLKDVGYVKNVTSYYRKELDRIFERRKEYVRASSGTCEISFVPDLNKSFNRGFTDYFLNGRKDDIASFDTPKSLGEKIGKVSEVKKEYLSIDSDCKLSNGDGLCFVNSKGELEGFRVNKIDGRKIYPLKMPDLKCGYTVFRNYDFTFNKELTRKTAERRISLDISIYDNMFGYTVEALDEDGNHVAVSFESGKEMANKPQSDNIKKQLSKLGNTPFCAADIRIELKENYFIPSSTLSEMRRLVCEELLRVRRINYKRDLRTKVVNYSANVPLTYSYRDNISNRLSKVFYEKHGLDNLQPAYELQSTENAILMFCKHCIKNSLGICTKKHVKSPYKEPFRLTTQNGKTFTLRFDCSKCEMYVVDE